MIYLDLMKQKPAAFNQFVKLTFVKNEANVVTKADTQDVNAR